MSDAPIRKAYRVHLEWWRCALIMSLDDATDIRVALMMLQCSNKEKFHKTGHLLSWHSKEAYAKALGIDERTVRRAWKRLQQAGVIRFVSGGQGRGDPNVFTFDPDWLSEQAKVLDTDARAASFAGQIPFIRKRERGTDETPFADDEDRDDENAKGGHQTSKGGQMRPEKGDTAMSPDPLDLPPGSIQPPSASKMQPRPNGRGDDSFSEEDPERQWINLVLAFDKRRTAESARRVLNHFAAEYGELDGALDIFISSFTSGHDPVAGLRKILQCREGL